MIEASRGERPGGWLVAELTGTVDELHGREVPAEPEPARLVWVMAPAAPALVLGSTQRVEGVADPGPDGPVVVRRRSGGGAVLVDPATTVWIDVVVRRGDPLWHDDVGRAFAWLGDAWAAALASLGIEAEVHHGALVRTPWSPVVCFAGVGPGEVLVGGRKVVGLSQRRTRSTARFQCAAYLGDGPAPIAAIARWIADEARMAALRTVLEGSTAGVPVGRERLIEAFVTHLPD